MPKIEYCLVKEIDGRHDSIVSDYQLTRQDFDALKEFLTMRREANGITAEPEAVEDATEPTRSYPNGWTVVQGGKIPLTRAE